MPLTFLNPALLFAAAAAVIPLIIHLLHRRKAREDYLPTMRFLRAGFAANRRRMRIRNFLVLFLRVLAVLLLVVALARPAYMGSFFSRKGTAPVNAVMVIDNSVSMAYERDGTKRFSRAKDLIKKAVNDLPTGSRVGLVVTGLGARGESLDRDFTFKSDAVGTTIDALDISAFGGDCVSALSRAYAMLDQVRGDAPPGREVYVASDLAAHAWAASETLKAPRDAETVILDVDSDTNENFHIDSATAEWRTFPAPPHVTLTAAAAAGDLTAERLVEVSLAGAKRAERIIHIAADSRAIEAFDLPILAANGPLQGRVALTNDDPIRADNTRYFTVPASRSLLCLVIRDPGRSPAADAAFFAGNALEPKGLEGTTGISVRYEDTGTVSKASLDAADVALLADAAKVPEGLWRDLREFAASGKGLVIFAGQNADADSYAAFLKDAFGVALGGSAQANSGQFGGLEILSLDHPMLSAFAGGKNGNLSATRVFKWRKLVAAEGTVPAGRLAQIGGDAAMLAVPMGAGRCVLAAFAPVPAETDLPLRSPFVPLANEMAKYAAGVRSESIQQASSLDVGSAITLGVARLTEAAEAEIITPLEKKPVKVALAPGTSAFVYRAFFPGNYVAHLPGKDGVEEYAFSVNIAASESSPDRISADALQRIAPGAILAKDLSSKPLKRVWGKTRGARELFDLALIAALVVLVLEEYAANRIHQDVAKIETNL